MAKMRTTQEAFLNRYLNGYQNTQASTVSGGRKKSAAAASAGERIMNSTSKQLPTMTDYSASIYSGIASNAKQAISEAEKLAAAQQKAALQAQKQAQKQATSSVRRTTRRSTSSKQTSGTASEDLAAAAKAALGKKVNTTQAKPDVSAATAKAVELAKKVAQTANAAKKDTTKNTTQKKATNPGSTYLTGAENKTASVPAAAAKQAIPNKPETQVAEQEKDLDARPSFGKKTAALRTGRDDIPSYIAKSFGTGVGGGTADIGKNVANLISLGVRLGDKIPFPDGDNEVAQAQQKVYEQQRQSAIDALNRLSAQSPVSGTPTNPLKTDLSGLPDLAERDQSSLADLKAIAELPALDTLTEEDKQKLGLAGETFAGRPVTNPLQTDALDDMKHLADQDLPFLDKSLNELSQMDNDYQAEQDRHGIVRGAGEVSRFGGNAVPQIASYALMNGALGAAGANELTNAAGGAISGAAAKGATKLGLNGAAKTLASEAAAKHVGNILLGQAADTALDTLPSLGNDILDYQDQQAQINNGEQVENPLTPGKIAANTAANVGTNLAFNVLGEGADALKGKLFKKTPDAALKQAEIPSLSASDAVSEQSRQLTLPKETGLYTTNLPDVSKSADEALQQAKIPSLDMADTISEQSRQFTLPKESEAYMPEMTKPGKDLNTAIPSLTEPLDVAQKVDVSAKPQTAAVPNAGQTLAQGKRGVTYTDAQTPVNFTWEVRSADDLLPSHDANGNVNNGYPAEQAPPSLFDEPPVGVGAMAAQNPIQFATNQDVATQHNMFDTLVDEDKVAMGAGQQTHQILTHGQGKKIGEDDFNALVQINNGDEKQAAQSLLDTLKGKTQLSAQENYDIMAAADVIGKNMQLADKDSAEHAILQAQQTRLYEKMSASLSESAQALNMAQKGEVSPIAKYYNLVDKITAKANPKEQKSAAEFAKDLSDMADTMGKDILADQPMNDEFEAFVKSQGIDTGSATGDKLEYVAKNVKETAVAHGTELNDEQAKQIAAKIVTGASSDEIKKEILKQAKGIHGLSDSEMQYVQYLADKIATLPDSKERYDCETEMYSALAKSLPAKSALDKLDNFRYLAMLGNTRTHARNIIGNVVMRAAVDAKDFVGAGLEHVFLPKDQRTRIAFARFTQNFRDMKRATADFMNSNVYSRVMTRDGKFNLQQGLEGQQTVFNTKWLEKVRKFFDNALSGEDDYFVKSEFVNSLAQNLTAKGYGSEIFTATDKTSKDVLEDAIQLALKDSDYATFHSDSVTAQGFSALSRHFRDKGGVGGIGGYVLVEGNLPFKKTPVNMFKDAIEFSGGGIAEGTYKLLSNLKTGKYTANEVIDDFAKGMTGAGVVAAGVGLGRAGLIHAGAVDNAAQDDFNTMQGKQHYSIEVPGGGTYTIDWAAPLIIPLLVGAEIGQYSADYGASLQELPEFIAAATSRLGQPLIEASFMQGIEDAFEAVSYAQSGDKVSSFISNSAQGYAQQFVPTVVGQIARSFDDTRRDNYGGGQTAFKRNLTYAQSKLENKLPGLSMTNEPYVDPWGNTQESLDGSGKLGAIGGFAARLGYNMLSPGYYSSNKTTETEQQLQSLYDATGNSSVFPSTSVNKVNLTGNSNYYMTPQEKTAYNTERGQQSKALVDGALSNPMFATLSDSDKATAISDMYSLASDIAKAKVFPNEKIDNKLYNAYSTGGADGAMNYIAGNTSLAAARDDKDGTLTKQESWQAIRNMPSLDDSQKLQSYLANTADSTTTQIYGQSGETAALAYLDAYDYAKGQSNTGSVSKTDVEDYLLSLPSLSADDFAGAYLGAYSESIDPKAHSAYNDLGADGLKNWIQYIGNADLNGNGSVSQKEAIAVLDEMNLTNEERAYYYALTNKSWGNKNHY